MNQGKVGIWQACRTEKIQIQLFFEADDDLFPAGNVLRSLIFWFHPWGSGRSWICSSSYVFRVKTGGEGGEESLKDWLHLTDAYSEILIRAHIFVGDV